MRIYRFSVKYLREENKNFVEVEMIKKMKNKQNNWFKVHSSSMCRKSSKEESVVAVAGQGMSFSNKLKLVNKQ